MISEIERFARDIAGDEALRTLAIAIGADADAVVSFAQSRGYRFSSDDLGNYAASQGALSDAQLDSVAGGVASSGEIVLIAPRPKLFITKDWPPRC